MRGLRSPSRVFRKFEIPGDRQRGRSQHHGVDLVEQPFIEQLRYVDRRGLQECSTSAPLDPVNERAVLAIHPEFQPAGHVAGPVHKRNRLLWAESQQLQLQRHQLQRMKNVVIRVVVQFQERFVRAKPGSPFIGHEQIEKVLGAVAQNHENVVQLDGAKFLSTGDIRHVARQFFELVAGNRHAEILPGDVLHIVRFIEDHGVIFGNNAGQILALHRQIGEQQVVIDDDDVGFLRLLVHLGDEAALELLAFLAGAEVAPRVDFGPGGAGFWKGLDFGAIAGFGGLLPIADDLKIGDFFEAGQHRLRLGVVNLLPAGVVGAPFHVADAEGSLEMLREKGDVLVEELLLQILRAGGDDDSPAGKNRRHQICERLAGTRPGLDNQMLLVSERRGDGLGHFKLPGAEFVVRMPFRQQPFAAEELANGHGFGGGGHVPILAAPVFWLDSCWGGYTLVFYLTHFPNNMRKTSANITLVLAATLATTLSAGSITTVDVPGAVYTYLLGISNNGVAVGYYVDSSGNSHGFERLANGTLVYPFDDTNGATSTLFLSVNNSGTVVGRDTTEPMPSPSSFVFSGGVYSGFAVPSCPTPFVSGIRAINDNGDVAGDCGSSLTSGYIQTSGNAPLVFSLPGALDIDAEGINNLDQVVGEYVTPSGTTRGYGYIRNADGTYTLIAYPGGVYSTAFSGINDAGVLVGNWEDFSLNGYAFYGTAGNFTTFSIPGALGNTLQGINNSDEVVGSYEDSNFVVHGFITTLATPEPSSALLGAIGLLGLAVLRKLRYHISPTAPRQSWRGSRLDFLQLPFASSKSQHADNGD